MEGKKMVSFWEAQAIFVKQLEEAGRSLKIKEQTKKAEKREQRRQRWDATIHQLTSCFRAEKEGTFIMII